MIASLLILGILGLIFGILLTLAHRRLKIEINPLVEKVTNLLPGANCGTCGYGRCISLAEAIVKEEAEPDLCPATEPEIIKKIAQLLGKEARIKEKKTARLLCAGGKKNAKECFSYFGIKDCQAAMLIAGGNLLCKYGCLGFGSCIEACPFEAIKMSEDSLPIIDPEKCKGCGKCVDACPKGLLQLLPLRQKFFVACGSEDKGAATAKNCSVGCIGCQKCVKVCEQDAITIENFLARIDPEKCNNCGKCTEVCPRGVIKQLNYTPTILPPPLRGRIKVRGN